MYAAIAVMIILMGVFWFGRDAGLARGDVAALEQAHAYKDAVAKVKDANVARMQADLAAQAAAAADATEASTAARAASRRYKEALDTLVAATPEPKTEIGPCDLRCIVPPLPLR